MGILDALSSKWAEFCRGNMRKMVTETFNEFDVDGDGKLSKEEVYPMVLSLYLKMACYTKIANDTVPTRAHVEEVFALTDADQSGSLEMEEFEQFAIVLCHGLVMRITVQLAMQVLLCPLLAVFLTDYFTSLKVLRVDWVVSALDQWQLSEGAYSMGKTVFTCLLTMLLLPLAMSSVGNLIILYVCGEGSKHEKKL